MSVHPINQTESHKHVFMNKNIYNRCYRNYQLINRYFSSDKQSQITLNYIKLKHWLGVKFPMRPNLIRLLIGVDL